MDKYIYECPVCNNLVTLKIKKGCCPFKCELVGRCDKCNNKIDIYEDDWQDWAKGKEEKSDGC